MHITVIFFFIINFYTCLLDILVLSTCVLLMPLEKWTFFLNREFWTLFYVSPQVCSMFCFAGFPTEDPGAALPEAVHGSPTPWEAAGAADVPPHL